MKLFRFSIVFVGDMVNYEDRLYRAGCIDGLVIVEDEALGFVRIDFLREASSREEAISSAINDAARADFSLMYFIEEGE